MFNPEILGLGTAVPATRYDQMDLYHNFMDKVYNNRRAAAIFRATEIENRYSVLPDPEWLTLYPSGTDRNDVYLAEAPGLGQKAISMALDTAPSGRERYRRVYRRFLHRARLSRSGCVGGS